MKRGMKLASLFLISLFLVSFLLVVVSAVEGDPANVGDPVTYDDGSPGTSLDNTGKSVSGALGKVIELFFGKSTGNWDKGELDNGFAKALLAILIAIVVFSIASKLPGLKDLTSNEGTSWLAYIFSGIIGYLSMAYITPGEVKAIMASYSAMGFSISIGIPFIILLYFTIEVGIDEAATTTSSLFKKIIAYGLWVFFLGYLVVKLVRVAGEQQLSANADATQMILAILILVVIAILFMLNKIWKKLGKMVLKEEITASNKTFAESQNAIKNLAQLTSSTSFRPRNPDGTFVSSS